MMYMKVRLGNYIEEYSKKNKADEDIPVYSVTSTQGFCRDYFGKEVASKDKTTYKIVPQGCFAYNPSRINVGSVDWQRNEERVIVSPLYNVFSVSEELDQEYLYYYLKSDFALQRIRAVATGSVRDNLKLEMLKEFPILLPPKNDQKTIANNLDRVKRIIELRKSEIDKMNELIKARFVEMFGSPVSNPMSWEKRTLKEVCIKLNDGSHFSPESFETGDYKYVTAKNIKFSGFDFSNITYVPEAVHRPIFDRCNPEFEDVLYIKDGATTGVAIVNTLDEEFTLLSSVALLKQDRSIMNGYFLATLLNNKDMYLNIRNNMGGAAITRLTIAKLNAIEIIVPPIELQNQFAAFVAEVDKSKLMFQKLHQKLNILQQKAGDI